MRTLSSDESLYRSNIQDKGNAILVEKTWGGGLAGPRVAQSSGEARGWGGALDWG